MKFANATRVEAHIDAGQSFRDGQFANGDFARPAAFVDALVGERKRILEILDQTLGIGRRRPDGIWILAIERRIGRAGIAPAAIA